MRRAPLGLVVAALAAASPATAGRDPVGRVVFARGRSLWLTDAVGKTPAVAIAELPGAAAEVRALRTDAAGATLLVDVGGRWYWAPVPAAGATATLAPLPCGPGSARLTASGTCVLCADDRGQAWLLRLADGLGRPRAVPAATASFVDRAGVRELVWAEAAGGPVLASPVAHREPRPTAAARWASTRRRRAASQRSPPSAISCSASPSMGSAPSGA